ncbi:helix-turn-helix domain-containing protein [Psychrobacter fulvigenes]|uniref:helix-turn-helix domain-containing protein n=1 Tax=Psychrobacter fulvigenes TaxID=533323 RepID=UPI001917BC60|nr:helix-turn-helix domain-containing protein [Psychrobacter fulvigenes]
MLSFEQYPLFKQFERLPDGSWHPEDIKTAIRKTGVTMAELCQAVGVPKSSASKALAEPFTQGEIAIAQYLEVPVQLLFPTRWTVDKKRVRPRYADKYTTVAEMLS